MADTPHLPPPITLNMADAPHPVLLPSTLLTPLTPPITFNIADAPHPPPPPAITLNMTDTPRITLNMADAPALPPITLNIYDFRTLNPPLNLNMTVSMFC